MRYSSLISLFISGKNQIESLFIFIQKIFTNLPQRQLIAIPALYSAVSQNVNRGVLYSTGIKSHFISLLSISAIRKNDPADRARINSGLTRLFMFSIMILGFAAPSYATTWYVRTD